MNSRDEVTRVLKLVESGTIKANEAADLLAALEEQASVERSAGGSPGTLRVVVSDKATGRRKVNLTLPAGLVDLGLSLCKRFVPKEELEGIDLDEIRTQLKVGLRGRLIDITDDEHDVVIEML